MTETEKLEPLKHNPLDALGKRYADTCAQLGEIKYKEMIHKAEGERLVEVIKTINNEAAKIKEANAEELMKEEAQHANI